MNGIVTEHPAPRQRGRLRSGAAAALSCLLLSAACADDATSPDADGPASIEISPATVEFDALGEEVVLRAVIRNGSGAVVSPRVVWTSSNPGVVTVTRDGAATAVSNGSAVLSASALGARASASATVEQQFASFQFLPTPRGLESGAPAQPLTVRPVDARGNLLEPLAGTVALELEATAATLRDAPLEASLGPDGARFEGVVVDGTQGGVRFAASWLDNAGVSEPFDVVTAFDRVLLGNAGAGVRGVLVDGTVGGRIVNDLGFLAEGDEIAVGSVRPSPGNNELIVFGDGHAPALVSSVSWTDGVDTLVVPLPDPVQVGVTIWVVKGPFEAQRSRAQAAVERTAAIWATERHGVEFGDVEYVDATQNPSAPDFYSFEQCGKRASAESRIGKRAGRLNIYYVERVDGGLDRGRACPVGGDFAVMAERTGDELLSHEVGHLFSLRHVDHLTEAFDRTNVMHSSSSVRRHLTEAQTFRVHYNAGSVLNAGLALRPGLGVRSCSREAADPGCPAIATRLWADGGFGPDPTSRTPDAADASLAAAEQLVSAWMSASCMAEDNHDLDEGLAALGDTATLLLAAAFDRSSTADGRSDAERARNERRRLAALHGLGLVNTAEARRVLARVVREGPAVERAEALYQLGAERPGRTPRRF